MKRTFLLLVCILCALIPMSAQKVISAKVAGVIYEALSDSTAKVTGWEHKSASLSIPSTLKMKGKIRKVVAIAPRAFAKDDQGSITDIVLPKYLVEITIHRNHSGGWLDNRCKHADRCCFSGAINSKNTYDFPFWNFKRNILYRRNDFFLSTK